MSAPSVEHEDRVAVLSTLADLAGLRPSRQLFTGGLRPDLVAIDRRRRRLLVADAKATESASCVATRSRFVRYADAARWYVRSGYFVRFALCHGRDGSDWADTLEVVLRAAGLKTTSFGTAGVGLDLVSWAEVGPGRPEP